MTEGAKRGRPRIDSKFDNWFWVKDARERKRIQDRLAQRARRSRVVARQDGSKKVKAETRRTRRSETRLEEPIKQDAEPSDVLETFTSTQNEEHSNNNQSLALVPASREVLPGFAVKIVDLPD
ncbi:hypothetical protein LTS17_008480 [Exophiala oligosperma]